MQLFKGWKVAVGWVRLEVGWRPDGGMDALGELCLLVDSLLCFVFVSKKLDPLSRTPEDVMAG